MKNWVNSNHNCKNWKMKMQAWKQATIIIYTLMINWIKHCKKHFKVLKIKKRRRNSPLYCKRLPEIVLPQMLYWNKVKLITWILLLKKKKKLISLSCKKMKRMTWQLKWTYLLKKKIKIVLQRWNILKKIKACRLIKQSRNNRLQ